MITKNRLSARMRGFGLVWKRHMEAVRISRELGRSSDRVLSDMGIARGDIDAIAHGRYGRR